MGTSWYILKKESNCCKICVWCEGNLKDEAIKHKARLMVKDFFKEKACALKKYMHWWVGLKSLG